MGICGVLLSLLLSPNCLAIAKTKELPTRKELRMDTPGRRRAAVFIVPMILGLVMAQRAAPHVRTVDFLVLFASGVLFGVSLMGLVQQLKRRVAQEP